MKTTINNSNYKDLIYGASLFTTGGGVPLKDQAKALRKLKNFQVPLYSLDEFAENNYICMAAELGPSDAPPLNKEKTIHRMFDLLCKASEKQILGVYPPEMGQESVVIETAHLLKLPIADFDPVGFRAVPYIDINIFNLKGLDFNLAPLVVATDNHEVFLIDGKISYTRFEEILRQMTVFSKSAVIFLMGGLIKPRSLQKHRITTTSYSKALQYGKIKDFHNFTRLLKPRLVLSAQVVKQQEFKQKGFFGEIVYVKDNNKNVYKIIILNEALFILNKDNRLIAGVPERILLVDPVEIKGIPSSEIKERKNISILVVEPEKEWKTKKAEKIFGKERFRSIVNEVRKL
jgi:DUF917 family protein